MLLQRPALCPLLGNCLFTPPSCVDFHANEGLGIIGTPLRFGKFGFEVTQRPLEPSSCDTFIRGFVLEAPFCFSRVGQFFDVACLSIAQRSQITFYISSWPFAGCDTVLSKRKALSGRGVYCGEGVEIFGTVLRYRFRVVLAINKLQPTAGLVKVCGGCLCLGAVCRTCLLP